MDSDDTDIELSEHENGTRPLVQDVHPPKTPEFQTLLSLPAEYTHDSLLALLCRVDADRLIPEFEMTSEHTAWNLRTTSR